ncbi:MAG: hypothetical protein AB8H86_20160 [Polyangiales bacterium]
MRILAALVALSSALGMSSNAAAHVPNIASFHLIPGNDAWRLEVHMSTAGMHQALQARHPDVSLSTLTPEAYETYLLEGLRAGIELRVDGVPLVLDHPIVEIRPHASRVVFVMTPPVSTQGLDARIDALSAREGQNNVLRFMGQRASRVVLKSDNNFRGRLELSASRALDVPLEPRKSKQLISLGLMLLGLGLMGSGARSIRRGRRQAARTC